MSTNEEMLLWAPLPTTVTSDGIAERIAAAAASCELVADVAAWFVRRHGGLYRDLVAEVEAACPKGVPNDYYEEVEKANGWLAFEYSLRHAVAQLDELMPDGLGWPCCARMDPIEPAPDVHPGPCEHGEIHPFIPPGRERPVDGIYQCDACNEVLPELKCRACDVEVLSHRMADHLAGQCWEATGS